MQPRRRNSFYVNDGQGKSIEIFVKCRKLISVDLLGKSDIYVIMKMQKQNCRDVSSADSWIEIGRTNVIADNLNPSFAESFIVQYKFEEFQPILFEVCGYHSPSKSDFLGKAECSLGELVKQNDQTLRLNLGDSTSKVVYDNQKRPKLGEIIIRYDEVFQSNDICLFNISTKKTNALKLFPRLFVRILRKTEAGPEPLLIYESTRSGAGAEIHCKTIKIKGQKLCNSDYNIPVIFQVWSIGLLGGESIVGAVEASLLELREKMEKHRDDPLNPVQFPLKLNGAASGSSGRPLGQLIFHKAQAIQLPSFLDYLRCGTRINLVLGIDFTASNQEPSQPNSLHYIDEQNNQKNQYQRAIRSVGDILIEYDDDKLVPTYGFGAEIDGKTEHAFPLSSDQTELSGIKEVLSKYKELVTQGIKLSGPTYFSALIEKVMDSAKQTVMKKSDEYYVLLILTDGQIHDMEATKRLIVDSSKLPLSIIIVGVGQDSFQNMHELDGDEGLIDSRGKHSARDLVQFVSFRQFEGNDFLLQKEVLQELPDQVVEYYLLNNRLPSGFEYQHNVNYIDFTRIIPEEHPNSQKQVKSPYNTLIHAFLVIAIGILLLNIFF